MTWQDGCLWGPHQDPCPGPGDWQVYQELDELEQPKENGFIKISTAVTVHSRLLVHYYQSLPTPSKFFAVMVPKYLSELMEADGDS